ncbi:MAG: restriction endonuclease subunit S [Verrucomicrobiales bacterium]
MVAQEASDEPASELLKRIAVEKTRLVKADMLKPERKPKQPPVPAELFELPRGWAWTNLQSICLSISDGDHQPPPKAETGVPFLVISDVRTKTINYEAERRVPQEYYDGLDPIRKPQLGDLLYTLVGSFGIPVPVQSKAPFCIQRHIGILRPSKQVELPALALFLESEFAFKQAEAAATGIAQKTVSLSGLRSLALPLPPLAEQRRIVAKVEELMALLDRLEAARTAREATRDRLTAASLARLTAPDTDPGAEPGKVGTGFPSGSATTKDSFPANARFALATLPALTTRPNQIKPLRQTILNLAVRGKLVDQDPTDEPASELLKRIEGQRDRLLKTGEIKKQKPILPVDDSEAPYSVPQSWRWARFNQIAAIQSNLVDPKGYPDKPHIAPDNIEGWTARLLPYVSVREAGVFSGKHLFSAGSILYSKIRPNLAKVTVADFDGLCSADMYPVRAHIHRDFLVKFMITEAFVDQSVSEDNRVAMPKINQAALSNILIPLPPLAEQHRIVAKVDALMALCDRLAAALATADSTRARLLEALLHEALEPGNEALEAAE